MAPDAYPSQDTIRATQQSASNAQLGVLPAIRPPIAQPAQETIIFRIAPALRYQVLQVCCR